MIVDEVDIPGFAIAEAENNPPICAHGQSPKALQVTLQLMQPKGRAIEIGDLFGSIEQSEDLFDLTDMVGIQRLRAVFFKKAAANLCV